MNANDMMMAKLAEIKAQQADRQKADEAKAAMRAMLAERKAAGSDRDKFGTRPDSGCGKMHVALAVAYSEGVLLSTRDLIAMTGYANVPNHIRTLVAIKQLAERRPAGYTLSPLGAALWHGADKGFGFAHDAASGAIAPETADSGGGDEVPAKGKNKRKKAHAEMAVIDAEVVSEVPAEVIES